MKIDENINFSNEGILGYDKREYSNSTLLIGKNGSGKSRFLKALMKYLPNQKELNYDKIIFLDFSGEPQGNNTTSENGDTTDNNYVLLSDIIVYRNSLGAQDALSLTGYIGDSIKGFLTSTPEYWSAKASEKQRDIFLKKFNSYSSKILGRKISITETDCLIEAGYSEDGAMSIGGELERMSPGERQILLIIVGLLAIENGIGNTRNSIMLIDEPEAHLHPKALISFIEILQNDFKFGYIFTASHSIFLLPQYQFNDIVYMDDGKVSPFSSKVYHNIYDSLVGKNESDGSVVLYNFLTSLTSWEYMEFISECFTRPDTVDKASVEDPQFRQLLTQLHTHRESRVIILDYGAGSGRIGKCIDMKENEGHVPENIDYYVYNQYVDMSIGDIKCLTHSFRSYNELLHFKDQFNMVLLFNVLHEIDVKNWQSELAQILNLLKDDGFILFGEKTVLSKGEDPYGESGYLILGRAELELIFGKDAIGAIHVETPRGTECFSIAKAKTIPIKIENIITSLTSLQDRTYGEIEKYYGKKKADSSTPKPREYAFYSQQYINTKLAISLLGGSSDKNEPENFINDLACADIINHYDGFERRVMLKKRARIGDEEGRKCVDYIEKMSM